MNTKFIVIFSVLFLKLIEFSKVQGDEYKKVIVCEYYKILFFKET